MPADAESDNTAAALYICPSIGNLYRLYNSIVDRITTDEIIYIIALTKPRAV